MKKVSVEQFAEWRETYQGLAEAQFVRLSQDFLKPSIGNAVYSKAVTIALERLYASPKAKLSTEPVLYNALSLGGPAFSMKMYRGEHGEAPNLSTRLGSLSFTRDIDVAEMYACSPNNSSESPKNPRVIVAEVKMFNPLVVGEEAGPDGEHHDADPFIDCSQLLKSVNRSLAIAIILDAEEHIYNTDNWGELSETAGVESLAEYLGIPNDFRKSIAKDSNGYAYDVAASLLSIDDKKLSQLYFSVYPVADNPNFVNQLVRRGYDGMVHGGSGESAMTAEYRPFSKEQIDVISVCYDSPELLKVRRSHGLPLPKPPEPQAPKQLLEAPPAFRPR